MNWQLEIDRFDSPHLRAFFECIDSDQLALTLESREEVTEIEQRVVFNTPGGEWTLPFIEGRLTDIHLTLLKQEDGNGAIYILERIEANLSFPKFGVSIPVTGIEMNHGELLLAASSRHTFPNNFVHSFVSESNTSLLIDLSGGTSDANYQVIISNSQGGALIATHQLGVDLHPIALPLLSEYLQSCSLVLLKHPNQPGIPTLRWIGKGVIRLDQEYSIELSPTLLGGIEVVIFSSETGFPGPERISKLLGLDALSDALHSAIQFLPFSETFQLHAVSFSFHPREKDIFRGRLYGTITMEEHEVFFSLGLPDFHLTAELNPRTPILLGNIIHHYLPEGSGISKDLRISALHAAVAFDPLSLSMQLTIDSIWETYIGNTPIKFDQLCMGIRMQSEKDPQLGIRATWHLGKTDVALIASNTTESKKKGWLFSTEIAHETTVSVRDLATELADLFQFTLPETFPDITLNTIDLSFHTGSHAFHLHAAAHLEKPFGLMQKGDLELSLKLEKDAPNGKHTFQLELNGTTTIQETELSFHTSFGSAGWNIQFNWFKSDGQGLHLTHLLSTIDPDFDPATIPTELEHMLTLSMISVNYDSTSKEFSGELRTEGGQELFISGRGGKDGGLLAGIGYHLPEDIPQFGEHLSILQPEVQLTDFWLVLNTFGKGKQLPNLPDVFPAAISKDVQNNQLSLLAILDLENGHSHAGLVEIAKQSPHSKLTVVGSILNDGIKIKADLQGGISFPLQKKGGKENLLQLEDSYLEFSVRKTGFNFELGASMQFVIDHMPLHPSLRLSISEKALRTAGRIQFGDAQHRGWNIFGLRGVEIQEIALLLGVEFAQAALEFGLFGKMCIAAIEPGETGNFFDFGIILELHGEIPNIQYFALSIQKVDFTQLIKALFFNETNAPTINTTLKGEDLSIYMAESKITLPDGTETNPGFGLHGLVTIFDWKAFAHLDAHPDSGIRGHLQLSPIVNDWFSLTGKSDPVVVNGYIDPKTKNWITLRNTGESVPENAVITLKELVEADGPILHLDTTASPYLSASAHVTLLHFLTTDLDIRVSDELLDFNVHFEVKHLADFRLHCTLKNGKELAAQGHFFAGIDIEFTNPVETLHLEIGIRAEMELQVGPKPKDFKLMLKGSIDFMGADIDIAALNVSGFPDDVKKLPPWLGVQFTKDCMPALHDMFQKAYDELDSQTQEFDQAAINHAKELLDKTRAWVKYVDDDIGEMQQELAVSFLNAKTVAERMERQSNDIEQQGKDFINTMRHIQLAELDHLKRLEHLTGNHSENQLERINLITAIQMNNMQREIHELHDENGVIRKAILALWEQTKTAGVEKRSLQEQSEAILRQSDAVDRLLNTIMLTPPEEKNMLYPEENGRFLPRAVYHHAYLIAQDKISAIQAAVIQEQAKTQVAVILNRAQQDVKMIHNLHSHGNN